MTVLPLRPYLEENQFTIKTDYKDFKCLFPLSDASGKLARWCVGLSEFEFNTLHQTGIRHQAADTLLRLPTVESDKSKLDDEVAVLNINPETFGTVCNIGIEEEEEVKDYSIPQRYFVPFLSEIYALANKVEESKLYISDLSEFTTAQKADNESYPAAATVGQTKALFSHDDDGIHIRVLPVNGASQ